MYELVGTKLIGAFTPSTGHKPENKLLELVEKEQQKLIGGINV